MSDDEYTPEKFLEVIREREAELERRKKAAEPEKYDADLVPEVTYEKSDADKELDSILDRVDIVEAYRRWCGKMTPLVRPGQTENIKVSCPVPGHVDRDPSVWINTDKGTWVCGVCNEGGDKYHIAAYHFGINNFQSGANFHRLRELMAQDLGYQVRKLVGNTTVVEQVEPEPEPEPSNVVQLHTDIDEDEENEVITPHLDWEPLIPEGTFLDSYMQATIVDDVPEEFHFFHALIALGFAIGRNVRLSDSPPVLGNLFVCTLGRSGMGKSKARRHLDTLLRQALPYDRSNLPSKGVLRVMAPASAESMIYSFMEPVIDPNNPKRVAYFAPVKGLIDFNELSSLIARSKRMGSVIVPHLMQFYDGDELVQTTSLATGSKEAHEPFASALTTTQPKAIKNLVDEADDSSGFLNRWIFVPGKEKQQWSINGRVASMSNCVKPLQEVNGWASTFLSNDYVTLSPGGYNAYDKFFHSVIQPTKKNAKNDILVRIDLTIKKLILLLSANKMERVASEETVQQVISMYPYLIAAYGIPSAQISTKPINNEMAEAIITSIQRITERTKRLPSSSEITRSLRRREYDVRRLHQVLESLVKMEIIEVVIDGKNGPGRKSARYRYVG